MRKGRDERERVGPKAKASRREVPCFTQWCCHWETFAHEAQRRPQTTTQYIVFSIFNDEPDVNVSAAICGILGYRDLFRGDWLNAILSWQRRPRGCWSADDLISRQRRHFYQLSPRGKVKRLLPQYVWKYAGFRVAVTALRQADTIGSIFGGVSGWRQLQQGHSVVSKIVILRMRRITWESKTITFLQFSTSLCLIHYTTIIKSRLHKRFSPFGGFQPPMQRICKCGSRIPLLFVGPPPNLVATQI